MDSERDSDPGSGQWRDWLAAAIAHDVPIDRRLPDSDQVSDQAPRHIARRPAAVLIAVTAEPDPVIFLTERSRALKHHPGQISFPGGRIEPTDAGPGEAALREAEEEIGLNPNNVSLLGGLPCYRTISGFEIRPFVGWVAANASTAPDNKEVARLFSLPLAHAVEPTNYRVDHHVHAGRRYRVYCLDYGNNQVWGATAAMLVGLAQRMAWVRGQVFDIPDTRPASMIDPAQE